MLSPLNKVFESPEFNQFSRDLNAAMKDADRRTPPKCPACGNAAIYDLDESGFVDSALRDQYPVIQRQARLNPPSEEKGN